MQPVGRARDAVAKLDGEHGRWTNDGLSRHVGRDKRCLSREAAGYESPARQCRESRRGTSRVCFSGRHEFPNDPPVARAPRPRIPPAHKRREIPNPNPAI
jgi:hypothetical protein